jgi:uncharacterized protein YjbJ (UPF0337 family)
MLEPHSIATALAALEASPMSRKKAMLLVLLIDAAIDSARPANADLLAHRRAVAAAHPALALVIALTAMREDGPRLAVHAVDAPPRSEAEYMISVYNDATIPRLMIVVDGVAREAVPLLRQAVAALDGTSGPAAALSPPIPISERRRLMDWNRVEGNWKQVKGKVKEHWGKLTDDDLDVIAGKRDQLEGKIQERYAKAKDDVRKDIDTWYENQTWH